MLLLFPDCSTAMSKPYGTVKLPSTAKELARAAVKALLDGLNALQVRGEGCTA